MYAVIILVCALGLTPKDCQKASATHIIHAPEPAESLSACMLLGMKYAAEANVVTAGYYPKVFCVAPTNIGREATG